ncbi:MAG: acyl-CoA dehydrogenase family protein, partial [Candidatus Nanopelagicales bacterium]|nr:acyl-CoA dehydrogenase family protein [Candidatus Nanopelagicales bacterium]
MPTPGDPFQTPERRLLAQSVIRFARDHIVEQLAQWEDQGELPRELHLRAAEAGLIGLGYPEDLDGVGGTLIDVTVMTESLMAAGASGGLFASLFSHGIALPHIVDALRARDDDGDVGGAQWLRERFVQPVLAGRAIASLAVTEPDGGSDVGNLRTRAVRDGDHWVINGSKTYITSGTRADVVVTAARIGERGAAGIALFAVDRRSPGFQ